jgi:hypothetical protein
MNNAVKDDFDDVFLASVPSETSDGQGFVVHGIHCYSFILTGDIYVQAFCWSSWMPEGKKVIILFSLLSGLIEVSMWHQTFLCYLARWLKKER